MWIVLISLLECSSWFQWENHSKSMKLEAQTLAKIRGRINEKVMGCCGTWIDWQYLLDAAALLAKCRYTLQYTYPYAYYMEPSPRKELVSCLARTIPKCLADITCWLLIRLMSNLQ